MNGPCVKQTVTATIVAVDGSRFVGTNDCRTPQVRCPREGMATGVGYELCRSVCNQTGHAEPNAIAAAGAKAVGAVLYLEGHTYACEPCKAACAAAGVVEIVIGAPPAKLRITDKAFGDACANGDGTFNGYRAAQWLFEATTGKTMSDAEARKLVADAQARATFKRK